LRLQMTSSLILGLVLCGNTSLVHAQGKKPTMKAKKGAADEAPLQFSFGEKGIPTYFKVIETSADGAIQVAAAEAIPGVESGSVQLPLKAGTYLGGVQSDFAAQLKGSLLVRLQASGKGDEGKAELRVGKQVVAKIETGNLLLLFPTADIKPADLKRAPESAVFVEGEVPGAPDSGSVAKLVKTASHLEQLAVALHNFHDQYKNFPPVMLVGPDGKPWHSWRVLLLPFLDQYKLYDQYIWTEPWDGPNNKNLIEKMPAVFGNPSFGDNDDRFTHVVAITGDGMAFAAEGGQFDGKKVNLVTAKGRTRSDFADGLSNTLILGPADPARQIPWTKPEDIEIKSNFSGLGQKDGFPLSYRDGKSAAGVFMRGDGSPVAILEGIDKDRFRSLLTISGREKVDWDAIPCVTIPEHNPYLSDLEPALRIDRNDDGSFAARIVMAPAARRSPLAPPKPGSAPRKPRPG